MRRKLRRVYIFLAFLGLLFGGILIWQGVHLATILFLEQTAERAKSTMRLTISGLRGALNRYQSLPRLISENKDIQQFLVNTEQTSDINYINARLKYFNDIVDTSVIYVLNNDGLTLASSNFDQSTSFVGRNYSYRPYYQDAIKGMQGRYFALGTASDKRGYYFSSPVKKDGNVYGIVVVKVNIDKIEANWKSREHEIVVTDRNSVVFMSSREDWRYSYLHPLSPLTLKTISNSRQYSSANLFKLPILRTKELFNNRKLFTIQLNERKLEYLVQKQAMKNAGWNVYILSNTASAKSQAYTSVAIVVLIFILLMLILIFQFQRRQRILERIETQQQIQEELEIRVQQRTSDLHETNEKLIQEVHDRKLAEDELRKTQNDLIQAGKLAALGQMSAALSHEFNQPLGAIKSYADNAVNFLEHERLPDAQENINRISLLVDRLASISKHLRNFARKPKERKIPVPIATVLNDAVEILSGRIKSENAAVNISFPDEELWVVGGQVRLQQVLVNIINNALDSTEHLDDPNVNINATATKNEVTLKVEDNGPGIPEDIREQIFDPFFTTKGTEKGLGLGLSISYNIIRDFDGILSVENNCGGGATFSITLKRTEHANSAKLNGVHL